MRVKCRTRFLVLLFALLSQHATAAEVILLPSALAGNDVILVEGEFQVDDGAVFHSVAAQTSNAVVFFNSPGGNLIAGLDIGESIQKNGFRSYVAASAMCASACALAWLSAEKKSMSRTAVIGFHAAYTQSAGGTLISSDGNALVGAYLNRLGLSDEAVVFVTYAPPEGLQRFSVADGARLGIRVSYEELSIGMGSAETRQIEDVHDGHLSHSEKEIRRMTQKFVLADNLDGAEALKLFEAMYDDKVFYFGRSLSKAEVLSRKKRFYAAKPKRFILIDLDSLRVECVSERKCFARFVSHSDLSGSLLREKGSKKFLIEWSYFLNDWRVTRQEST